MEGLGFLKTLEKHWMYDPGCKWVEMGLRSLFMFKTYLGILTDLGVDLPKDPIVKA